MACDAAGSAAPPQSAHWCWTWVEESPGADPLSPGTVPFAVQSEGTNTDAPVAYEGNQCNATARTRSQTARRGARDFTASSIAAPTRVSKAHPKHLQTPLVTRTEYVGAIIGTVSLSLKCDKGIDSALALLAAGGPT